jgi:glucose-6-phosphate dehydrogenase assembly protein OpcA
LAAVLDQPPYEPVTAVRVVGSSDSPSTELLAQWLGLQLRVEVDLVIKRPGDGPNGIHRVLLPES